MKRESDKFYLVRGDFLTEAMKKTLQVKKELEAGRVSSIYEAVHRVGLSRSAFYKYRDAVFPFQSMQKAKIMTLLFHLEDQSGTLSHVLDTVARAGGNILTINQSIPLNGKANVTLSFNTEHLNEDLEVLIQHLKQHSCINKIDILGTGV